MPEIIDGFSYETTPVIPASTNTPAGGNRPFPSAGSPGRSFWQLLKRYAQELDKFESGPIRALTDRVVAAEAAVATTTPRYRFFTTKGITAPNSTALAIGLDSAPGDNTSESAIVLSSDGLTLTLVQGGLYEFVLACVGTSGTVYGFYATINGQNVQLQNGNSGGLTGTSQVYHARIPAGATATFQLKPSSGNTIPAGAYRFSALRLGA